MFYIVYQLYWDGERLAVEDAQARPVQGWLHMHSKNPESGNPMCKAYLLFDQHSSLDRSPIPPLWNCRLTAISGGIRLSGFNELGLAKDMPQGWWVVPQ